MIVQDEISLTKVANGENGTDAKLLYLTATAEQMTFDADDVVKSQTITVSAKLQNVTGTASFTAIPYIGNTAQSEITLGGSGNNRTLTSSQFDKEWSLIAITATLDGLSDTLSVVKVKDGADGVDGEKGDKGDVGDSASEVISGYLTNEAIILPADASGTVSSFANAAGKFNVYEGNIGVSSGVSFTKVSQTGITCTIDSSGNYSVTAMSADSGMAIFRAVYKDSTIDKILMVVKSKQGESGEPTGVTESATAPATPYIGMLWKNSSTDVTYRWNGSAWKVFIFTAENISVDNLAAIKSDLGEVTAGTINGVKIISEFQRDYPYSGSAHARKGDITTENGRIILTYNQIQKSNNTVLQKGSARWDEQGFYMQSQQTNGTPIKAAQFSEEGIFMTDANFSSYGQVSLAYEDLMTVSETQLTPASGYSVYDTGTSKPAARRTVGKIITLSGAFKNNESVTTTTDWITMGIVPTWAIPSSNVNFVVQGSGMNRFQIQVTTSGNIRWARYGTGGSPGTASAGAWLNISCVYTAA